MPGEPSRTPSAWSKADTTTPYSNTPDVQSIQQEERVQAGGSGLGLGRVVGGKYIEKNKEKEAGLHDDHGPLMEIEQDMPLTLVEVVQKDGKDYMELRFANGDKEIPYNWDPKYKSL